MNIEMAYLLGMICGNGEIQRTAINTIVSIDIPHKKLQTEEIKIDPQPLKAKKSQ